MKYHKMCECCGHKISAYTHSLNKPLVQSLKAVVEHYERTGKACNLQQHLNLTKNQYNNFQKLQYFDFVVNTQSGWFPKQRGKDFIYGKIVVKVPVATFGKQILGENHEAWETHKKDRRVVSITDIDSTCWKQKVSYQEEKTLNLFM